MQLSKKKIILFTPGPIGGAEKIVANGAIALHTLGEKIELWVIRETRVPDIGNKFLELLPAHISVKVFESRGILDFRLFKELWSAQRQEKGELLHTHGFKALFYGYFTQLSSMALLHTHHGKTGHTLKVKFYEYLETLLMRRSFGIIAVSQEMKKSLIQSGIVGQKINVIENFLTMDLKIKGPRVEKLRLLFVGRLSPEKGCDLFIKALQTLPADLFHVSILGDGIQRNQLHELSKGMGINFLGFQNDVSSFISEHDVLVMPSLREGQPLALIEAVSSGMPVVASHVGGIPEIVHHNKNGYLFPSEDILQLAEALLRMKENYDSLKAHAEYYAKDYQTRFSSKSWAQTTQSIYQRVLAQQ